MTPSPSLRSLVMAFAAAAGALLLPGCSSVPSSPAGTDMEITRDIKLKMREDARFRDVQVVCENRIITLSGRVNDKKTAQDAVRICRSRAPGARLRMNLDVRPR